MLKRSFDGAFRHLKREQHEEWAMLYKPRKAHDHDPKTFGPIADEV